VTLGGDVTANSYTGIGTGLTALNATQLTSGTVPSAQLPIASTAVLGAVKVDGTTITANGSGVLSVIPGGVTLAGDVIGFAGANTIAQTAAAGADVIGAANLATVAQINGARVIPSFGAQNISTTGTLSTGNATVGTLSATTTTLGATTVNSLSATSGNIAISAPTVNGLKLSVKNTLADDTNAAAKIDVLSSTGATLFKVDNTGAVTGASFTGAGSGLTALNASNISSGTITGIPFIGGTINSAVIGGTTPAAATFTTLNAGTTTLGAVTGTSFSGVGTNLTALNASNITTGTISNIAFTGGAINSAVIGGATPAAGTFTNLAATGLISTGLGKEILSQGFGGESALNKKLEVQTSLGATTFAVTLGGDVTANSYTGIGTGLTALNATQLTSGTVPSAQLPIASTAVLGAVKVDGTTITATGGGVISVMPSSVTLTGDVIGTAGANTIAQTAAAGADVIGAANAATVAQISGARVNPAFGAQNVSTSGTLSSGNATVGSLSATGITSTGLGNKILSQSAAGEGGGATKLQVIDGGGATSFSVTSGGAVTGASFTGSGTGLTALNASNLTSGTVPSAQLPIASTTVLGAVKVDGTSITATGGGVISVVPGGVTLAGDVIGNAGANTIAATAQAGTNILNAANLAPAVQLNGARVIPSFGAQAISTTGTLNTGNATVGTLSAATTTLGATTVSSLSATSGNIAISAPTVAALKISIKNNLVDDTNAATKIELLKSDNTQLFKVDNTGAVTGFSFSGIGTGLTALNASNLSSGTVNPALLPTVGAPYVLKAGDTMTGLLTLSGAPTAPLHAATKAYVDAETARATNAEGNLSTSISNETTRAENAEGLLSTSISNEVTRATAAETTKVSKAGDTMSGALTVNSGGAGNVALKVQGAGGQTANLQEWNISGGAAVASVSPAGAVTAASFSGNGSALTNLNANNILTGTLTGIPISGSAITGGTINNTPIGGVTPSSGAFTTLSANGGISSTGGGFEILSSGTLGENPADKKFEVMQGPLSTFSVTLGGAVTGASFTGNGAGLTNLSAGNLSGTITGNAITGSAITGGTINGTAIDNAAIGATTAASGKFTTLNANSLTATGAVSAATFSGDGSALTNLNASALSSGTVASARLPIASTLVLGAVKVDGTTVTADGAGVISVVPGGVTLSGDVIGNAGANTIAQTAAAGADVINAANLATLAQINGARVNPNFGAQAISTSGSLNAGSTTVGTLNAGNTTVAGTLGAGNTSVGTLSATTTTLGATTVDSLSATIGNIAISAPGADSLKFSIKNSSNDQLAPLTTKYELLDSTGGTQLFKVTANGNVTATKFIGDGSGLTNLPAGNLTGTISGNAISGSAISGGTVSGAAISGGTISGTTIDNTVIGATTAASGKFTTLNANSLTATGAVSAATFSGDGSALTNLNAGSLSSGTVASARLPIASTTVLGAVKVDGTSVTADVNGVLSVIPGGVTLSGDVIGNAGANTIAQTAAAGADVIGAANAAAVAQLNGTRVNPNFGAQAISTTGTLSAGTTTLGAVTATSFSGAGTNLTALNASNITSGTISNIPFTGGAINSAVIGGVTPAAGTFTALTANGTITSVGANFEVLSKGGVGEAPANKKLEVQTDTGTSKFAVTLAGDVTGNSFTGIGTGLTALNANNITNGTITNIAFNGGAIDNAAIGTTTASTGKFTTLNATSLTVSGAVTAASFSGDGSALANLNASDLSSGTVASARLPIASTTVLGAVKVDGTTVTADVNGVLSVPAGGITLAGDVSGPANNNTIGAGKIFDANVNVLAAISGTKVVPSFGTQNITTTGTLTTGDATVGALGALGVTSTGTGNEILSKGSATDAGSVKKLEVQTNAGATTFGVTLAGDVTGTSFSGVGTNLTALNASNIASGTLSGIPISGSAITGGSIDNAPIGATIASSGKFTTLNVTGASTLNGLTAGATALGATTAASLDNTPIGNSTASSGKFTTLNATGATTLAGLTAGATTLASLDSTPIGNTVRSSGKFTTLDATGATTLAGLSAGATTLGATTATSLDNTPIGNTTRSSGKFTTLDANGGIVVTGTGLNIASDGTMASVKSITFNGANSTPITDLISATPAFTFGVVNFPFAKTSNIVPMTGVAPGDTVIVEPTGAVADGFTWSGQVSAANQVTIRIYNGSGTNQDPTPGGITWRVTVLKH